MTTKITELTPEQRAAMKPWAEKWIKIGLSTEPPDREQAEAAPQQTDERDSLT